MEGGKLQMGDADQRAQNLLDRESFLELCCRAGTAVNSTLHKHENS